MRIFQLGYPGGMGGANTECWHTVKLWRRAGWDVTLIPTWRQDDSMRPKLDALGVQTVEVQRVPPRGESGEPDRPTLQEVPGLAGSIVVGMCNSHVCAVWDELRAMGCKIVWVNCMTFLFEHEMQAWLRFGPADAYIFQSEFQRSKLEPVIRRYGYTPDQGFLVRGAFALEEFPYRPRPHVPGEDFTVGRLARPEKDKWSSNHWPLLQSIPYEHVKPLCMGWNRKLDLKCGLPPEGAECLEPQAISVQEFLRRCHCLFHVNGGARENWPRVGLEAMAAGVPIVAEDRWGWPEMVINGKTGFLARTDADLCYHVARLAREEGLRLEMAEAARAHVERLAAGPPLIAAWEKVFEFAANHTSKRGMVV